MEKLKNLIAIISRYAIPIIASIVLIFFLINRCGVATERVITKVQIIDNRAHIIDSLKTANYNRQRSELDSLSRKSDKEINRLKGKISKLEKKLNNSVQIYDADTTAHSPACDSIITDCNNVIEALGHEAEEYSRKVYLQTEQIKILDSVVLVKDNHIKVLTYNNKLLEKQLKKQNNWFHRAEKWIYLTAGALAMYLAIK